MQRRHKRSKPSGPKERRATHADIKPLINAKTYTAMEIEPELYQKNPLLFWDKYGKGPYYKTRPSTEVMWDDQARRACATVLREAAKLADSLTVLPSEMAWQRWMKENETAADKLKAWRASLQRLCGAVEGLAL